MQPLQPQNAIKRSQGFDATLAHFYEGPADDASVLEVWCYTDALSYEAGDTVNFHLNTTADRVSLQIQREGGVIETVYQADTIAGKHYPTPDNFYAAGCGWPVGHCWNTPGDLRSGFYLVTCRVENAQGLVQVHEAGFFIRPKPAKPSAKLLLIAATSTWSAYNDWGGTSNYVGFCKGYACGLSPQLSIHRPWAKGFLSLPGGAPRKPHDYTVNAGDIPRYPPIEFAYSRGYSKYYASAGWATYEKPFVQWAEQNGYALDYATQHDLQFRPELLQHYNCVITVGHDEYWSHAMRVALDTYIENGGHLARFAGNFAWQIRLEDEGKTQLCYKDNAADSDPVMGTEQQHLLTSVWEDPLVAWQGADTVGLNAHWGIYAGVGHMAPRQGGGFTIYRPEHWALRGTDLCYGDQFGNRARIFGYEVDGLDYLIKDGLPQPTYQDGALPETEIIAMGLASNVEADHGHKGSVLFYGGLLGNQVEVMNAFAEVRYKDINERTRAAAARGSGMIVCCQKGKGQIFNAGTCEWVAGLKNHDACTEQITRNVLNRFSRGA